MGLSEATDPADTLPSVLMASLAEHDSFERWMAGADGSNLDVDGNFADQIRELRADPVVMEVSNLVGPAEYVEDLEALLNLDSEEDLCIKAVGLRNLVQVSTLDGHACKDIDDAVHRHANLSLGMSEHQQHAQQILDERDRAWAEDNDWMDALNVDDEATRLELERLNQRARQAFDISALGGLSQRTDSLKALKGIGDKMEMYLYAMGIRSYEQLAQLTPELEAQFDALIGVAPGRLSRAGVVNQCKEKLDTEKQTE